jgi:hypothetical protein
MLGLLRLARAALVVVTLMVATGPSRAAETEAANDMARFLAGLQPGADSPLAPLTREGTWQQHARYFDNAWKGLDSRRLSRIRQWSSENLAVRQPTTLYMFSGPDFLYVDAFLPGSATYVMSGLEPVGRLPEMKHITRRTLPGVLGHLRASTGRLWPGSMVPQLGRERSLVTGTCKGPITVRGGVGPLNVAQIGQGIGDLPTVPQGC